VRPRRRDLAWTLFTVGATAYGGPAIVAQIREAVVLRRRWVTEDEFQETLAFCQMLPGPVAVQTAAHVGWRMYGGLGALIALVAYVLPAFVLMVALSAAYFLYGALPLVAAAFRGLGAVIVAIVVQSILALAQPTVRDLRGLALTALAAWGFFAGLATLPVLAAAGAAGALLFVRDEEASSSVADATARHEPPSPVRSGLTLAIVAAVALCLLPALGLLSPALPALGATMAKIDLLAFGGGYTAIALMFREVVGTPGHAWLTARQFIDGLALGQITPGPVIITATFIGYRVAGVLGALVGTLYVFLPTGLLLTLLAPHFARLRRLAIVRRVVRGLLAAFVAMLLFVLAKVAASAFVDLRTVPLAAASFVALRRRAPAIVVIVAALAVALLVLR
jgi:chromate transporter